MIYEVNVIHNKRPKKMDGHVFNVQIILNNRQKSESFTANYDQQFKSNMSINYLHNCIIFKLVKQINSIGDMNSFTKPNFMLCMEEWLNMLKNIRDQNITLMNNNSEIYWACQNKNNFYQFS